MNNIPKETSGGAINGISIASFLQMLEQERHSCQVQVASNNRSGTLYFKDGALIDAEQEHLQGIEAAYTIISWENPSISLGKAVARSRLIEHPLGFILLNAAKQQDEQTETMAQTAITYVLKDAEENPDFQKSIRVLTAIEGIRYFFLLNKSGKIVVYSAPTPALGELIIYCIITSSNLRKILQVQSPRRIHMHMKDGSSLLILPKAGKILGMVLDAHSSVSEISNQINAGLSVK